MRRQACALVAVIVVGSCSDPVRDAPQAGSAAIDTAAVAAQLTELAKQLERAVNAAANAPTTDDHADDRAAARARLDELLKQKAELEHLRPAPPVVRRTTAPASKECLDNPLAKGCS
jgi:hypothetical protein